jgi:hypothetical protein
MSPKANGSSIGTKGVAVERQLPCKLTEAELLERGESMAEAELQIDSLKADRRAVQKQINEQIDLRNKLAHTVDSGEEMRVVQCRWQAAESQKLWRLIREDTDTEIETRAMTAADLQGSLSFPADDDDAPAPVKSELQEQIAKADKRLAATKKKTAAVSGKSKGKGKSSHRAHA